MYYDLDVLIRDIEDHCTNLPYVKNQVRALEDVRARQIGFRCGQTKEEWWISISRIKGHRWGRLLSNPPGRKFAAKLFGDGHGEYRKDFILMHFDIPKGVEL